MEINECENWNPHSYLSPLSWSHLISTNQPDVIKRLFRGSTSALILSILRVNQSSVINLFQTEKIQILSGRIYLIFLKYVLSFWQCVTWWNQNRSFPQHLCFGVSMFSFLRKRRIGWKDYVDYIYFVQFTIELFTRCSINNTWWLNRFCKQNRIMALWMLILQ